MNAEHALTMVEVRARSSRSGVKRRGGGELVVHVHAPAIGGAANRECVAVLARALRMPKSAVQIVRGATSRSKAIKVDGLSAAEVQERLERAARGGGGAR